MLSLILLEYCFVVASISAMKKRCSSSHILGVKGGRQHVLQHRLTLICSVFKNFIPNDILGTFNKLAGDVQMLLLNAQILS